MKCLAIFACLLCCSLAQTDNTCPLKDDPNCKCDISLTLILCDATASDSPSTLPQFLKANSNFSVLRMEGYQRNNTIPDNFFDFGFGVKRLEIVNCSFTKFEPLAFAGAFEESVSEFLLSSETIEDFPDLSMMRNLTSVFLQFNSVQKLTNLSSLPVNLKVLSISGPNLIELDTDSFDKIWSLQQLSISAPKMEFLNFTSVKSLVNLDTVRLATNITSFFGLERIRKLIINSNICNLSLPDFDHLELLEITGDLCLDELTKNVRGVFLLKFILEVSNDNVTALDLINFTIPKFELITYQTVDNSAVKIAGNSEITSLSLDRIPVCSNSFMSFVHLNTLRLGYVNWPFIPEEIGQLKSLKAVSSAPVICNCSNFWVYQKRHIGLFQDPSLPETYCLNSDMTFVRYLRRTALDKSCANFVGGVPVFQEEKCVGIIPTTTMITTTSPTTISTVDFTSTTHE